MRKEQHSLFQTFLQSSIRLQFSALCWEEENAITLITNYSDGKWKYNNFKNHFDGKTVSNIFGLWLCKTIFLKRERRKLFLLSSVSFGSLSVSFQWFISNMRHAILKKLRLSLSLFDFFRVGQMNPVYTVKTKRSCYLCVNVVWEMK